MPRRRFQIDLPDDAARAFIEGVDGSIPYSEEIANQLSKQIPVKALPVMIGAVVEAGTGERYIRWALDSHTHSPWIMELDHENPFRTDQLPVIVRTLFIGVEARE